MKLPHFRPTAIAGGGIFSLSVMVLVMLYLKPALADNDLFKSLSQAIIIQGLIGLAMAFYFTGKDRHTDQVEVVNTPDAPVPTQDAGVAE